MLVLLRRTFFFWTPYNRFLLPRHQSNQYLTPIPGKRSTAADCVGLQVWHLLREFFLKNLVPHFIESITSLFAMISVVCLFLLMKFDEPLFASLARDIIFRVPVRTISSPGAGTRPGLWATASKLANCNLYISRTGLKMLSSPLLELKLSINWTERSKEEMIIQRFSIT